MVSYGPWTQEPDYPDRFTYDGEERFLTGMRETAATDVEEREGEPYVITTADLEGVYAEALADTGAGGGLPSLGAGAAVIWGYDLTPGLWTSRWRAYIYRRPFQVAPPEGGFYPTAPMYEYPDNAIGVEYQGIPFDPEHPWGTAPPTPTGVALHSSTTLTTTIRDTTSPTGDLRGEFETFLRLDSGSDAPPTDLTILMGGPTTGGASPVTRTLDERVDLTPHLASRDWEGVVFAESLFVAPWSELEGEAAISAGGDIRFGWRLRKVVLEWMLRPPVYRWVYSTTPYRRTSHRHDSLAGGATRNYPPSRAVQTSNRIGGGYP